MKETIEQYKIMMYTIENPLISLSLPNTWHQFILASKSILGLEYAIEKPTIDDNLKFIQLVDVTMRNNIKMIEETL